MHLCGALSPRFISLAANLERVDAFMLCPCCLKGSLGHMVKRNAKQVLHMYSFEMLTSANT